MAGELELDNLQGPFQPKPFYDSMEISNRQNDSNSVLCKQDDHDDKETASCVNGATPGRFRLS